VQDGSKGKQMKTLAQRLIWWKRPEEAIEFPRRLLAQVMTLGTWEDVQLAKQIWNRDEFVAVLHDPPPGVFDARSWNYWHTVLGLLPAPALPERRFP
jgi:hypothetical protein